MGKWLAAAALSAGIAAGSGSLLLLAGLTLAAGGLAVAAGANRPVI